MPDSKTFWVQFPYQARVVRKGRRTEETVFVKDEAPVQIACIDDAEAPAALRLWKRRDGHAWEICMRSWRGYLWRPLWENGGRAMSVESFAETARQGGGGRDNPFVPTDLAHRILHQLGHLQTRGEADVREWISDDRTHRAAGAARAASSLLVCGDAMMRRTVEPLWRATASGDSVTVEWILGTGETPQSAAHCFRIDRFYDAMRFAEELARETGLGFAGAADCGVDIFMPETLARNDVVRQAEATLAAAFSGAAALLPGLDREGMMAYCDLRESVQLMKGSENATEREAAARDGFEALLAFNADLDSVDDTFRAVAATLRRRLKAPLLRYVGFERSNLTSEELAALDDFQTEGPRP